LLSFVPFNFFFRIKMQSPESYSSLTDPDNLVNPVGLSFEVVVTQKAADETCSVILAHREANQAVLSMAEIPMVKSKITSEEGGPLQSVQKRNDFLIRHAWAPDFMSDLTDSNAPASQELPLILKDIFIQNIHRAGTRSSWWFIKTSRASRTDSAIASWLTAPRQFSMMASQDMPFATWSRTSATRMRVPRKVGAP
jgi:hypothetical protein